MKESDILYENGRYWVYGNPKGFYEVMRAGSTHSTRVAIIGNGAAPSLGFERAKAETDRRAMEQP